MSRRMLLNGRFVENQKETVGSRPGMIGLEMETRLSHLLDDHFGFDHPAMACLTTGQWFICPAVQDSDTAGRRELLVQLRQQNLTVKKQMVTVQEEDRINQSVR